MHQIVPNSACKTKTEDEVFLTRWRLKIYYIQDKSFRSLEYTDSQNDKTTLHYKSKAKEGKKRASQMKNKMEKKVNFE